MKFAVNGAEASSGVVNNNNGTWSYTWPISTLKDATYSITATALDSFGNRGQPASLSVQLARGSPSALTNVTGGYNRVNPPGPSGSGALVVELDWDAAAEGSVTGYEVWKGGTQVCAASLITACMDTSPATTGGTVTTYTIKTDYTDGTGAAQQSNTTYNVTAPSSGSVSTSWWPTITQTAPSAHCYKGFAWEDLSSTAPAGSTPATITSNGSIFACTPALPAGVALGAGTVSVDVWITNTRTKVCSTTWFVYYNASPSAGGTLIAGTNVNGAPAISVPANTTTPTKFTGSGTLTVPTFVSNDQLTLQINNCSASGAGSSTTYYNSTTYPTKVSLPTLTGGSGSSLVSPGAIISGSLVVNGDGTRTLNWTVPTSPAGTPPPDFFRIYRDGTNYTNRLDTVDATQTTVATASAASATTLSVPSTTGFSAGASVLVDTGANQDTMTIASVSATTITFTAGMPHAHAVGVPVVNRAVSYTDTTAGGTSHTYCGTSVSATLVESVTGCVTG
jgi:hypothetical protein